MKNIYLNGLLFGAMMGVTQASSAALAVGETVTISFPSSIMNSSSYGYGVNLEPVPSTGVCQDTGGSPCYYEDGFVIGSPYDGNGTNHLHRYAGLTGGGLSDKALAYHGDSSGLYLRAQDQSSFNLLSMIFKAPISADNYIYGPANDMDNPLSDSPDDIGLLGPQEKWEIFGFSSAVNPDIHVNDGYATAVAYASIANGFYGTVGTDPAADFVLGDTFKNVAAIWIHYNGYPITPGFLGLTPEGIVFDLTVDNIVLGAPVSNVPVPAAVWMFGTGLLGMWSFGRKKAA